MFEDCRQKIKSKNMEVHQHSHHSGRKNWRTYFWEFLMLFLAVFCGFLAEYRLEHVIEHQREKKLMQSLADDLEADKTTIQTYTGWRTEVNSDFDSLLMLLSQPGKDNNDFIVHRIADRVTLRFGLPDINEGTVSQLKNAGGLRLVRKKVVTDAVNKHYLAVNRMKSTFETERLIRMKLVDSMADMLDASFTTNSDNAPESYKLVTTDKLKLNHFMMNIVAAKKLNKSLLSHLDKVNASTIDLKELIVAEYKLQ
jgi:hypothetical protein